MTIRVKYKSILDDRRTYTATFFMDDKYRFSTVDRPPETYEVYELEAEEDSLVYITNNFNNIPDRRRANKLTWFGDMAKFIYHHLEIEGEQY